MAESYQVKEIFRRIELIDHTVISDSESVFGPSLQTLMRKEIESPAKLMNFAFDRLSNPWR